MTIRESIEERLKIRKEILGIFSHTEFLELYTQAVRGEIDFLSDLIEKMDQLSDRHDITMEDIANEILKHKI